MELAHPAGAESLAPQPPQLVSAVASTKKSLLANFAQPRWPSPAESQCDPGCQKDQKSAQDHALPAPVIGRADGGLSDRTTMVQGEQPVRIRQDYWSGLPRLRGNVFTYRERKTTVNACKFGSHLGKIQVLSVVSHQYNLRLGDALHWLDGPIFVFGSLQNVSWHGRAVPETYSPALSRMCWQS
jgi:hypothetical protein